MKTKYFKILFVIPFSLILFTSPLAGSPEFLVNTYTDLYQEYPDIAMDSNGNFVIVWDSAWQYSGLDVIGRRYDSNGNPIGGEFKVSTIDKGGDPQSIAMSDNGAFFVTWEGLDDSPPGIKAQLFDNNGNKMGGEFQVNTYGTWYQTNPDAAMASAGNFVITWESADKDGSPGSLYHK